MVIDKGAGKEAELKKAILCTVREGWKGLLALGRWHPPPALQRAALWCHPCLTAPQWWLLPPLTPCAGFPRGAGCQAGAAGRSRSPGATGNFFPPLCVCVWSSLHKPGPEGFCGKGQALLGHVSASLSVAVAVAGCFIASRCHLLNLLTGNCIQLHRWKASLNYLTCKGYLNWKLQTSLHPPVTLFNL